MRTIDNKKERYALNLTLNEANNDIRLNLLKYTGITLTNFKNKESESVKKKIYSTWLRDIPITTSNIKRIMEEAISRCKIENDTFNTLKNEGYNFGHNYGHGDNNCVLLINFNTNYYLIISTLRVMLC